MIMKHVSISSIGNISQNQGHNGRSGIRPQIRGKKTIHKIQENIHKESDFKMVSSDNAEQFCKKNDRTAIGYFCTRRRNVLKYMSRNSQRQIYHYCDIFKVNTFHSCLLFSHITHSFLQSQPCCLSRDGHRCCYKLFFSHLQDPALLSSITTKSHFCHAVNHG